MRNTQLLSRLVCGALRPGGVGVSVAGTEAPLQPGGRARGAEWRPTTRTRRSAGTSRRHASSSRRGPRRGSLSRLRPCILPCLVWRHLCCRVYLECLHGQNNHAPPGDKEEPTDRISFYVAPLLCCVFCFCSLVHGLSCMPVADSPTFVPGKHIGLRVCCWAPAARGTVSAIFPRPYFMMSPVAALLRVRPHLHESGMDHPHHMCIHSPTSRICQSFRSFLTRQNALPPLPPLFSHPQIYVTHLYCVHRYALHSLTMPLLLLVAFEQSYVIHKRKTAKFCCISFDRGHRLKNTDGLKCVSRLLRYSMWFISQVCSCSTVL